MRIQTNIQNINVIVHIFACLTIFIVFLYDNSKGLITLLVADLSMILMTISFQTYQSVLAPDLDDAAPIMSLPPRAEDPWPDRQMNQTTQMIKTSIAAASASEAPISWTKREEQFVANQLKIDVMRMSVWRIEKIRSSYIKAKSRSLHKLPDHLRVGTERQIAIANHLADEAILQLKVA
ncbi:MAG TPA: hypothetical protein VEQ35_00640 [Beijerinckia sp.]|jgi:hypothetical protein|nr:hypothetical protein [Beijerinckia sp.]